MSTLDPKAVWPGWKTVKLIGKGSFGSVYEIERNDFDRLEKAALKVISIPQNDSDIDDLYDSGYDEASVTATFKSHLKSIVNEYSLMREMNGTANVVNCDDYRVVQRDEGIGWDIFIKMELVTPITKAVPLVPSDEQVIQIGEDMCQALILCGKYGIIHRDIKPQNIFVSKNGDYKLGDFGIAKTVEKTTGGTKIGTYKYMAPEVYNNQPYNQTVDIYSLGLVLHWLLNEHRQPFVPLPPETPTALLEEEARLKRFKGEPVPAPAHGSEELKQIVLKACAYDPKERYQSAEAMLRDLREIAGEASGVAAAALSASAVGTSAVVQDSKMEEEGLSGAAESKAAETDGTIGLWEKASATKRAAETNKEEEKVTAVSGGAIEEAQVQKKEQSKQPEKAKEEVGKEEAERAGADGEEHKKKKGIAAFIITLTVIGLIILILLLLQKCHKDQTDETTTGHIETTTARQTEATTVAPTDASTEPANSREDVLKNYSNLFVVLERDSRLNMRENADSTSDLIAQIPAFGGGEILEDGDDWVKISSGGYVGYVKKKYLATGEEAEALALQYTDKYVRVHSGQEGIIRSIPSAGGDIVFSMIPEGAIMSYLGKENGYYHVRYGDHYEGYISSGYSEIGWYLMGAIPPDSGGQTETTEASETLPVQADWSDWKEELPDYVSEDNYQIEEQVLYSSRKLETTSSTTTNKMDGWELYNTASGNGDYGAWSDWSKNEVTKTDTREVQKQKRYRYRDAQFTVSSEPNLSGWVLYDTLTTFSDWSGWSGWSTDAVSSDNKREVETKVQYRYKDKYYTSSQDSDLSGWTLYDSSYDYGSWSDWSDTPIYGSSTIEVETRQVQTGTRYYMAHYCTGNTGDGDAYKSASWKFSDKCSYHELGWFDSLDAFQADGNFYKYYPNGQLYKCSNSCWYFCIMDTEDIYKTQYRSRSVTTYYYFYKWGDWSEYSDTAVASDSDREVQTRTLYRYRTRSEETQYCYYRFSDWSSWSTTEYYSDDIREAQSATFYRYRDRVTVTTYYFRRWSSWSNYTTTAVASSDTTEVRTKKQYRYKSK